MSSNYERILKLALENWTMVLGFLWGRWRELVGSRGLWWSVKEMGESPRDEHLKSTWCSCCGTSVGYPRSLLWIQECKTPVFCLAFVELLVNSLDEVSTRATYVTVDVLNNETDTRSKMLIEDGPAFILPLRFEVYVVKKILVQNSFPFSSSKLILSFNSIIETPPRWDMTQNVRLVELCTLRTIAVLKEVSGTRSFVILIKHPTCHNDPLRTEDLFTYYNENGILQDSSEPSNDNTNVANALREPFVVNQDPGKNSSQSPPQINHHCCYGCSDSLEGIFCHQCTCRLCGNGAHYGYNCPSKVSIVPNQKPFNSQTVKEFPPTVPSFDQSCYSKDGNSFTYASTSNLVHDSPNVFDPPSQLPFYSCELCGNDARYGHYCTPQVLFIYPEPCYNQDFNFPQDFHDFQQQYLCCENCGVTHEAYHCQPMNEDYEQNSCYDPNSFGFDQFQPQQYTVNHPIFNTQNDLFDSQNELMEQLTSMCDMVGQFIQKKEEEKQIEEDQAANARYWKIPACYDDDDDDYTFSITPNEPDNSLSMGDEHLDTILATKSDEFIKSSVENLVPNPSESEGEHECDVPACEDFTTFSNILFDTDYDFYSSDDQSFSDEDVPKKIYSNPLFDGEIISMKIDPHHFNAESDLIESLLNHDSSKIDSLFDEFASELTLLKSVPLGIDKTDCDPEEETHSIKRLLYDNSSPRPPKEFVSENSDTAIESFSLSPIPVEDINSLMEEIDLSFTLDDPMPPGIEEDNYDSERDMLILEELISNDSLSLPENESFHFDIPSSSRPLVKPPDGNTGILNVKMMGDISKQKVPMPRLMITLVPK
uniref:Uncharacterized protein n=1 Tax=Tanacetum cinerariifolium TaxID=118510 RepID=A0A6L2NVG2_TANCI|nr:hypothetical protein [Tanacetum cinerariifolium]